jgi:hypothetical protein
MVRLAGAILAAALLQAPEDPLAKLKAPQAVAKVREAWAKKKGCAVKLEVTSSLMAPEMRGVEKAEFDGFVLKDFAVLLGSAEIYARGTEKLIKQDKEYVEPRKANAKNNRIGTVTRNPAVTLGEVFRFAASAAFGSDEKVGAEECRIIETAADERTIIAQVKELTGNLKSLEAYFVKDMTAVTDKKKSTSAYKLWVSTKTALPVKLEWTLTIAMDKRAIPFGGDQIPDEIVATYVMEFSKFDAEIEVQVPAAVKQKLGGP